MEEDKKALKLLYQIKQGDFIRAGEASSKIKHVLNQLNFSAPLVRRVAIAAYEAEMNIVIHSWGGELEVIIDPPRILLWARDTGPGILDIPLAMEEGYSTAPDMVREMGFGAGMGLPNMKSCADKFIIDSQPGKGTVVHMVISERE